VYQSGHNQSKTPEARVGKSGAMEVFESKHAPSFSVVTRWVSLEYSSESSVAAMLDRWARRG